MAERERCPNCGDEMPRTPRRVFARPVCSGREWRARARTLLHPTPPSPPDPDATKDFEPGAEPGGER